MHRVYTGKRSRKPRHQVIRALRGRQGLALLWTLLLQQSPNITILALDFEYQPPHRVTEIRITTFSANEWDNYSQSKKNMLESKHYITPRRSWSRTFLFGKSEKILGNDIPEFLKILLSRKDTDDDSGIVLVGHSISAEIEILKKPGIDLRDHSLYPIIGVLDTWTIAKSARLHFGDRGPSLGGLVKFLGIPCWKSFLHNSGNDAHFTMRCLLVLAARAFGKLERRGFVLGEWVKDRIQGLEEISREEIDFEAPTRDMVNKGVAVRERNAARKAEGQALRREAGGVRMGDEWWGDEKSFGLELFGV